MLEQVDAFRPSTLEFLLLFEFLTITLAELGNLGRDYHFIIRLSRMTLKMFLMIRICLIEFLRRFNLHQYRYVSDLCSVVLFNDLLSGPFLFIIMIKNN